MFEAQGGFQLNSQFTIHGAQHSVSCSVCCGHNQHQDCCEGLSAGSSLGAICTRGFRRHYCSPLHSKTYVSGPECSSSCLSNMRRTSRVCCSLSSRWWVRDVKSFTSLENSSMRKKNEHKPFWDEHTYFPEQWLESLAICTSNSCRILLGRSKCILRDVMPYDRRFCVETVGNRQAWIYRRLGMNFPISCTMLKWITSLWFVRTEEQDHFSSLSHRNPFQNFPWIRFFLFSEKLWQALPLPLRKGSWPLPKYKMLDFICGLLMKKRNIFHWKISTSIHWRYLWELLPSSCPGRSLPLLLLPPLCQLVPMATMYHGILLTAQLMPKSEETDLVKLGFPLVKEWFLVFSVS